MGICNYLLLTNHVISNDSEKSYTVDMYTSEDFSLSFEMT